MIECSISGDVLREHRTNKLKMSLRALGSALPIAVVAAVYWQPEFFILVLICSVLSAVTSYATWQSFREMALPATERFVLQNDMLIHSVAGVEKARVLRSQVKNAVRNRHGFGLYAGHSVFVPASCDNFAAMEATLLTWGEVRTPKSMRGDVAAQVGFRGIFFVLLLVGALIYLSYASGAWPWFLSMTLLGLASTEVLWRVAAKRSARAQPVAF
jgi:hypothetical protein